jgi:AAA domain-containing protein
VTKVQDTPEVVFFDIHERLSALIHGDTKLGKSTLANTAPKPALVLDMEGSWRFTTGRKVYWNPDEEDFPEVDGTWDTCIVHIRDWNMVKRIFDMILDGQIPVVTVVLDSITELQRRLKRNLKPNLDPFKIQDWGVLLDKMDMAIRDFRDLAMVQDISVRCVIFIAESRERSGKWRPHMQGQIADGLPYWVDLCGYMYKFDEEDDEGQVVRSTRQLWIAPHDQFVAGSRVEEFLGEVVEIPKPVKGNPGTTITDWMIEIFKNGKVDA